LKEPECGTDRLGEAAARERDDIDHAAHGAAAVDGGNGRAHNFDLIDIIEREIGEVIVRAGDAHRLAAAVHGDKRLVAVHSVNENGSLRALISTRDDRHARHQLQSAGDIDEGAVL